MAVVDLTHTLTPGFPLFPVYDPVRVADKFAVADDGFYVRSWAFDEHSGTHVDAPAHFGAEAATVDRIAPDDLVLTAAVLDLRERALHDHDLLVTVDDVRAHERRHGSLPGGCALLAMTGWDRRLAEGGPGAYLNADAGGTLHCPGFDPELTDWLREERPEVRAIGLDTASLDIGASTEYPAHVSWLPSGRYGIENLTGLHHLPPAGARLVVGAPKLLDGSGGPARVLAIT